MKYSFGDNRPMVYFGELDLIEQFTIILLFVMCFTILIILILELIDMHKMNRGYIVDKSFLKMEERCGERLDTEVKITVRNRYVTNYICDI